jgi:hypothetical protein
MAAGVRQRGLPFRIERGFGGSSWIDADHIGLYDAKMLSDEILMP